MNKTSQPLTLATLADRHRATVIAMASVRAEGLEPSQATQQRLTQYANGTISVEQLQQQSLAEAKALANTAAV